MRPVDETTLSEAIRTANGPLAVHGGGTRSIGQVAGMVLEAGGLAGVRLYEPGALTLVAGAGTPLSEIDSLLASERQRLAFEAPDLRNLLGREGPSTLGGVVATNASGPRRVQAGACRDSLIGVRFVDGSGQVIKNGGRVMKNVTGYDLVKLMAGSHGTLGVLTEVCLKLQAIPETETTLVAHGLPVADALQRLRAALKTPYDISGAAHLYGQTLIRIEGLAGSVTYRATALRAVLGGDWAMVAGPESAALWCQVRDVTPFVGMAGAVWRLVVKPSAAAGIVAALGSDVQAIYDWGGGLIWLLTGKDAPIRTAIGVSGHATLVRPLAGMQDIPIFPPEHPEVARLSRGVRAKFDPRGILNAGLMD